MLTRVSNTDPKPQNINFQRSCGFFVNSFTHACFKCSCELSVFSQWNCSNFRINQLESELLTTIFPHFPHFVIEQETCKFVKRTKHSESTADDQQSSESSVSKETPPTTMKVSTCAPSPVKKSMAKSWKKNNTNLFSWISKKMPLYRWHLPLEISRSKFATGLKSQLQALVTHCPWVTLLTTDKPFTLIHNHCDDRWHGWSPCPLGRWFGESTDLVASHHHSWKLSESMNSWCTQFCHDVNRCGHKSTLFSYTKCIENNTLGLGWQQWFSRQALGWYNDDHTTVHEYLQHIQHRLLFWTWALLAWGDFWRARLSL